ncbi:hypothetical protein AUJ17_04310 [Candidatus Micrarchaeota archaeon CG1_02_47_40]|nr:MAG: hypothetical protein AUJ17_04310 [Candidatus Micrarchaeota archaeon CG1_02_47_40]
MGKAFLAFALFFFFFSLASAQGTSGSQLAWESFASDFAGGEFFAPTLLALAIGAFIAGIAWMFGEFFSSPQLKAWVKGELYELGGSALMVALVAVLLVLFAAISQTLAGNEDFYSQPKLFLNIVKTKGIHNYVSLNMYEMLIGFFSTMRISLFLPMTPVNRLSLSLAPAIGTQMVSEANILITDFMGVAIGITAVQLLVLEFFEKTMLKLFLPIGILLRCFFLTRRLGTSLVVFALVAYFVFPASVMVMKEVWYNTQVTDYGDYMSIVELAQSDVTDTQTYLEEMQTSGQNAGEEAVARTGRDYTFGGFVDCGGQVQGALKNLFCSAWLFIAGTLDVLWIALGMIGKVITMVFTMMESLTDMRKLPIVFYFGALKSIGVMTQYLTFVVAGLVLEIIITITAYRSLAAALGGEVEIFGLSKLV